MQRVQMPMIPVVGEWISQHPGTISLAQGVVHYAPPPEVAAAVIEAAKDGRVNRYGFVRGVDELLEQIASKVSTTNGISMDRGNCAIVTAGSNMAFMNAVLAIAEVDDEIVLLSPFYFNHEMAIDIAGNLFVTTSDGIAVYAPNGALFGLIEIPNDGNPANCAFGGTDARTLFITAREALYRVRLARAGLY